MKQLFFITVFLWGMNSLLHAQFAAGTGTESDPYQIKTLSDLNNVRNYKSSHFKLMNNLVFGANDDLNGAGKPGNFNPLGFYVGGRSDSIFTGSFDGGNYTITGMKIDTAYYAGFFGYVRNAVIKNVKLVNCTVSGGAYPIGGIVAEANQSVIENCTLVNCTITSNMTGMYVGGIVGELWSGSIENCLFDGGSVNGMREVGGIVGNAGGTDTSVRNCKNTGNVTGSQNTGGIAGYIAGVAENCINTGKITGVGNNPFGGIGGCFGSINVAKVNYCRNTGEVSAPNTVYVGGVVGTAATGYDVFACANEGNVTGDNYVAGIGSAASGSYNTGNITGNDYVAGIYYYGSKVAVSDVFGSLGQYKRASAIGCYNTGKIKGKQFVGGITSLQFGSSCSFYIEGNVTNEDGRMLEFGEGGQAITAEQLQSATVVSAMNAAVYLNANSLGTSFWHKVNGGYPQYGEDASPATVYNVGINFTPFTVPLEIDGIRFDIRNSLTNFFNIYLPIGSYSFKLADYQDNTKQTFTVSAGANNIYPNTGITSHDITESTTTYKVYELSQPEHLHLMRYANNSRFELKNDIVFESRHDFSRTSGNFYPIYYFSGMLDGKGYAIRNLSIQADSLDNVGLFESLTAYRGTGPMGNNKAVSSVIRNLRLENVDIKGRNNVGAIAGIASCLYPGGGYQEIDSCFVSGKVSGIDYVGGLTGRTKYNIHNCTNEAKVSGQENIGGIAGHTNLFSVYETGSFLDHVSNKGAVSGVNNVGGIAGSLAGGIRNSGNTGEVAGTGTKTGGIAGINTSAISTSYNAGTVKGNSYVGGISGHNDQTYGGDWGRAASSDSLIMYSYNQGDIIATGTYVGGISGVNDSGIKAVYNTGGITVTNATYVGGITGYHSAGPVISSYNAGKVKVSNAGGFIGSFNNNAVRDSLSRTCYLRETDFNAGLPGIYALVKPDINPVKLPKAVTVEELQHSDIIDSLNMALTNPAWKADFTANINNGFPILVWQTEGNSTGLDPIKTAIPAGMRVFVREGILYVDVKDFRQVSIYDIMGRAVGALRATPQHNATIDISHLPAGIYIVKAGNQSAKFIKK